MSYRSVLALALTISAVLCGCDNDVQLLEDGSSLPVVYGLYDSSQDEQVLSVSKTFRFAEGAGAEESAMTPDSVFFSPSELTVVITNESNGRSVTAERFDAAAEGRPRSGGAFPSSPNIAYRYSAGDLEAGVSDILKLDVQRGERPAATSTITVLPEYAFQEARPAPRNYSLTSTNPTTFRWQIVQRDAADLVEVLEIGFNFAYTEVRGGQSVDRELYWPAATNVPATGGVTTASLDLRNFFGFLKESLEVDPSLTRRFRYIQLVITGGDASFAQLRTLVEANRGITSTQELPAFSNVANALGLYGSITQLVQDAGEGTLRNESFDALYGLDGDAFDVAELNFRP